MADVASVSVLNSQILQKQAARATLVAEQAVLDARVTAIDAEVAVLDSDIADLQAALSGLHPIPTLTSVSLTRVVLGSGTQALSVVGTGFNGSYTAIHLNGSPVATTVGSGTAASCTIPSGLTSALGAITVQIVNSAPGGGVSSTLSIPVVYAEPAIGSLTPASVVAPAGETTVTITGTGFSAASVVYVNGIEAEDQTFVSATEMSVVLAADLVDSAGVNVGIYVINPTPGGGLSGTDVLLVG